MQIELNRRSFLIVLGLATAATTLRAQAPKRRSRPAPLPHYSFSEQSPAPPYRPRTAAVTYVSAAPLA